MDDDFGLSEKSVSILFGQGIEYKIASAVAPNFTVVAKIRKSYLPTQDAYSGIHTRLREMSAAYLSER